MRTESYRARYNRQRNYRLDYAMQYRVYFPGTIDQVHAICDAEQAKPINPDHIMVYDQINDLNARVIAEMRRLGLEIEPTRGGIPPQPRKQ